MRTNKELMDDAVEIGRQLKCRGKEYYAIYVGYTQDAYLEFVRSKIEQLYSSATDDHWVSTPGVIFKLVELNSGVVSKIDDTIYIHKRKLKRHLRKAVHASRISCK